MEAAHAGGGSYGAGGCGAYGGVGSLSQAAFARLQPGPYLSPAIAAFANAPPIHPVRSPASDSDPTGLLTCAGEHFHSRFDRIRPYQNVCP